MSCHRQLLSLQSLKPKNKDCFSHLHLNIIQHPKKAKGRLWLEAFGLVFCKGVFERIDREGTAQGESESECQEKPTLIFLLDFEILASPADVSSKWFCILSKAVNSSWKNPLHFGEVLKKKQNNKNPCHYPSCLSEHTAGSVSASCSPAATHLFHPAASQPLCPACSNVVTQGHDLALETGTLPCWT